MPDDLTNTDKKIIYSDHDLLVRLNTKMDMMIDEQKMFRQMYDERHTDLVRRVTALEVNQAKHDTEIDSACGDITDLQKKSNMFDIANAFFTSVVAAVAYFTGR